MDGRTTCVKAGGKFEMRQRLKFPHWVNQRRFCCPSQLRISHLTQTRAHSRALQTCMEPSNEAFFVLVPQGLGCSGAETWPVMLSWRFWSSPVRSCSTVTSHSTGILANSTQSSQLPFYCSWTRGVRSAAHWDPRYATPVMYWAADNLSNESCLI